MQRTVFRSPGLNGTARDMHDRKNRLFFPKQSAFQCDREMTTVSSRGTYRLIEDSMMKVTLMKTAIVHTALAAALVASARR